jgi:ATP-dependent protease Clp ATPase subunit
MVPRAFGGEREAGGPSGIGYGCKRPDNGVIRQYQSALMHYNEAIHLKFEQKVADEVAKAGFRQKPGPKNY